ncbi:MAG: hypothetical protein LAN83_00355 [Acidobacteriia bacterium]|nr:hypothetical protein [Terriglobia bacterium]
MVLLLGFAPGMGQGQTANGPPFQLFLSEVQPGAMATEQRCTLVFPDRRFHYETASTKRGREFGRKVYEGELPDADWRALTAILDSEELRKLNVPRALPSPVMQDVHIFNISVAREGKFQNLEFLNDKSRKPYDSELKPLLQWWKSFNHRHMSESHAAPSHQCSLDINSTLFAQ